MKLAPAREGAEARATVVMVMVSRGLRSCQVGDRELLGNGGCSRGYARTGRWASSQPVKHEKIEQQLVDSECWKDQDKAGVEGDECCGQ